MDYSQYNHEKTGYLKEDFRLFHITNMISIRSSSLFQEK